MTSSSPLAPIPNIISLLRLLSVPVTIYLIVENNYQAAFWLFIAAGVSDAVDGAIAKRFNVASEFGAYLDPLADKALLVGVYVALAYTGHIATWLVFLIVFRDFLIIGGALLFHTMIQSLKMLPLFISKVNTMAQIVLAAVVLGGLGLEFPVSELSLILTYIVAVTTFVSGAAYVFKWTHLAITIEKDQ